MSEPLTILEASRLNEKAVVVGFSDGTAAIFTVQQLCTLTPDRSTTQEQRGKTGEAFDGDRE